MKLFRLSVLSCLLACTANAQAEIYKRVDADGHVTYSSAPIKGSKKLQLEPLPAMTPTARERNSESGFPKVDGKTQTRRDTTRRKILEDELDSEVKALEDARAKLKEAQDSPEVYKTANGKTLRNVAKYEEKVNAEQDEVSIHENNIQALKTELSNLK
jgi:hypothetical protein